MRAMLLAMRRTASLLLALLLGCCALPLSGLADASAPEGIQRAPDFTGFPDTDSEGYLQPGILPGDEFVHQDEEAGVWVYTSPVLRVEVYRMNALLKTGKTVWYEAEIRSREPVFRVFSANPQQPRAGYSYPHRIARQHGVVLALNGDFYTFRIDSKIRLGVIIRDGQILSSQTNAGKIVAQPPLDELVLFPDGRMEVRYPREMSAKEYLERGALDVLAFGPVLLREGQLDDRIENKFRALEPRSAIGMVAPGHYIAINAEGRNKRSAGVTCLFLAQRMLERGATTAFNLDGGWTSAMVFMGKQLNQLDNTGIKDNARKQNEVLGIGVTGAYQ